MSERLTSARKNETFVTRAAAYRTREKGAKGRSAAPFSLLRSLFLGQLQGWVTHVLSASTPFVGTQTPTLQILIRSPEERTRRNACRNKGGFLPDRSFVLGLLRIGFPPRQRVSSRGEIWSSLFKGFFFFEFKERFK